MRITFVLCLVGVAGKSLPDFLRDTKIGERAVEAVAQRMKAERGLRAPGAALFTSP
jgi:hypothetical protein